MNAVRGVGEATALTNVIRSVKDAGAASRTGKVSGGLIARSVRKSGEFKRFRLQALSEINVSGGIDAVADAYKKHRDDSRMAFTQMSTAFAQLDLPSPVMTESDTRSLHPDGKIRTFTKRQGFAKMQPLFAKVRQVKIGRSDGLMGKSIEEVSQSFDPMTQIKNQLEDKVNIDSGMTTSKVSVNAAASRWSRASKNAGRG